MPDRIMKLAFVHNTLAIGGIEKSLVNLLNRIDYNRFYVDVYILTENDMMLEFINENANVYFKTSKLEKSLAKLIHRSNGLSYNILMIIQKLQRRVLRALVCIPLVGASFLGPYVQTHYDAVFALEQGIVQRYALSKLVSKRKHAFYHNGNLEKYSKYKKLFSSFDSIVVVSRTLMDAIVEKGLEAQSRVSYMHNLIPQDEILAGSFEYEPVGMSVDKRLKIVSCGRLYYEKGFDFAVKVAFQLKKNHGDCFIWYIIGDGREKESLDKLIIELGLSDQVVIVGWKKNPYPYIAGCDIYVQPSRLESYGITIVEAQVLGKVVVATDTLGAKEVIEDGKTGLICKASIQEITKTIEYVIGNEALCERIRKNVCNIDFEKRNETALQQFFKLLC